MSTQEAPFHIYYDYCNLGGVTSIFKQRIQLLRRSGIKNRFIFHFLEDLGGRKELDAILGVETKFCPSTDFHGWVRGLIEHNPNGKHILIDQPEILAGISSKYYAHLIYEVHTSLEKMFKRMRGVDFSTVSRVVCPSQWLYKKLAQHLKGFDADRICICPNFVDARRFLPLKAAKRKDSAPMVLWVGKLNTDKNITDALDILRRLNGRFDFQPVFVTGGGMDSAGISNLLWRFVAQGFDDRVRWICDLPNAHMPNLLAEVRASSGILLSTSKFESFGLAALEALSCGVPVVAAEVGGLPEVVRDGRDGFLFPLGDNEAAARAVANIIGKPAIHAQLSAQAVAGCARFDPKSLSKAYFDVIQKREAVTPPMRKRA